MVVPAMTSSGRSQRQFLPDDGQLISACLWLAQIQKKSVQGREAVFL